MLSTFFHVFFYNPIYNALVAIVAFVPGGDVGVAVILLTILIRLILLPFTLSAARTQRAMKEAEPHLKAIKEKHQGDKEKEAMETLALYRERKINPFSGILTAFIQIPVLLALYWVFRYEHLTTLDSARLYAFTPVPAHVSLMFLGIVSVSAASILLAVLAGGTQYLQAHLALSGTAKPAEGEGGMQDFQRLMGTQMKFVFPILIGVISYSAGAAVALYFITTNLVGSLQELYVRKKIGIAVPAISESQSE